MSASSRSVLTRGLRRRGEGLRAIRQHRIQSARARAKKRKAIVRLTPMAAIRILSGHQGRRRKRKADSAVSRETRRGPRIFHSVYNHPFIESTLIESMLIGSRDTTFK